MDTELERAAEEYEEKGKIDSVVSRKRDFINGANWKEEQIIKDNMLLPFKEYDNLMESVNKQKKEGYEAGYKKGLEDIKEDIIKKVRNWLEDNFYYHDTIEEKYDFINDLCKALENETTG